MAIDRLFALDTTEGDLLALAGTLGSDVPFALLGGTALGNILTDDWPAIWDGEACRAIRAESAKMEHICQLQTGNRGKEGC